MTYKRPSDFVSRARIAEITSPYALRRALTYAEQRVAEADFIRWPALAASWRLDVALIRARMEALRVAPSKKPSLRQRGVAPYAHRREELCA